MHNLTNFFRKRKKLTFVVTCISVLILALISPASASINNWEFSPQEPACGDTINIRGSGSPEDKVDVFVTFEKTVPVSEGRFEYILEDVKIPEGLNNFFTVEARGAKDLNVRVKMIVWVSKSSKASGDTAIVSQSNVPQGTYMIKIDGDANEGIPNVDLKITAYQGIEADSKGDFSYSYNTKAVPAGDFEIKVGSITKKVTIQPERSSDSNSDSFSAHLSSKNSQSTNLQSANSPSANSPSAKTKLSQSVENESSTSSESNSSSEQVISRTQEEYNGSEVLTPDKNQEEEKIQAQSSEKSAQKSGFIMSSMDKFYLLIGMVAAVLILIACSRKK